MDLGPANGGMLRNLGEGGLALTAASRLTAGDLPLIRFDFPETSTCVEARGRIVWLSESGKEAGVEFEPLADDELVKIRKWISTEQGVNEPASDDQLTKKGERLNPIDVLKPPEPVEEPVVAEQALNRDGTQQPSQATSQKRADVGTEIRTTVRQDDSRRRLESCSSRVAPVAEDSPATGYRRSYPRQKVSSLAYVDLGSANGGMLRNLSEGGLALTAAPILCAGELPCVRFELPEVYEWIEARGRIVWLSESGKAAGIEFKELPAHELDKVKSWLAGEHREKSGETRRSEGTESSSVAVPSVDTELEASAEQEAILARSLSPRRNAARATQRASGPIKGRSAGEGVDKSGETRTRSEGTELSSVAVQSVDELEAGAQQEAILARAPSPRRNATRVTQRTSGPIKQRSAAILALIALASFAAGIVIDRGFHQRSSASIQKGSEMAVKARVVPSKPLPAEKTQAADAKASDQSRIAAARTLPSSPNASTPFARPQRTEQHGSRAPQQNGNSAPRQSKEEARTARSPSTMPSNGSSLTNQPTAAARSTATATVPSNKGLAGPLPLKQRVDAQQELSPQSTVAQPESHNGPAQNGAPMVPAQTPQTQALGATVKGNSLTVASGVPNSPPVSPSISITVPPFPSIRVPPGLKSKPSSLGTSLQMGQLASRVEPTYPSEAVRQGIEGTVKVHASIGSDGAVQSVVASGPHLLAEVAMSAVRQWRYRPTRLGGQAIEADEDVVFVFRLSHQKSTPN